jgi:hypothetical protein
MYTTNAKISNTMLGIEDHGILTFSLSLTWGAAGQGFGGYALDQGAGQKSSGKCMLSIRKLLETVGVNKWEDLKGQLVRIRKQSEFNGSIDEIGHIIDDKWFNIKEYFQGE